jgi:hypothetical protein
MSTPEGSIHGPTKLCPHCQAMAQTTDKRCPNCGKKYKRRRALRVVGWMTAGGIALIVLVVVLISLAANGVQHESDKHAITPAQYRQIRNGMTKSQVESVTGGVKPATADEISVDASDVGGSRNFGSNCRYYNRKGELLTLYQLCFDNDSGRLQSKAKY